MVHVEQVLSGKTYVRSSWGGISLIYRLCSFVSCVHARGLSKILSLHSSRRPSPGMLRDWMNAERAKWPSAALSQQHSSLHMVRMSIFSNFVTLCILLCIAVTKYLRLHFVHWL